MGRFDDNSRSIGGSPLIKLNRIVPRETSVFAKIEGRNPAYSVKDRIGAAMVWDAEKTGRLRPGMEIIEPTSGNTGISLAFVAAARNYKVLLAMPESLNVERRKVLKIFGASLILTEAAKGMKGAIAVATDIAASDPKRYFMPQQFENPANPAIHEATTGPEIWDDTSGAMDILVSGVGTGGTITGVSRYFKLRQGKKITSIAVEPEESPVITQTFKGEELKPGSHKIAGIGAGFIPKVLQLDLVDRVETVTSDAAIEMARRLAREEGILCGISSGAAAVVAARVAAEPESRGKTIVVIFASAGERYLSSPLFQNLFPGIETAKASDTPI